MRSILVLFSLLLTLAGFSQTQPVTKANYAQAAKFSPKKLEKILFSTAVDPHWLKNTNRFWYMYETTSGKRWFIVDPVKGTKTPMFDNDRLAAQLTRIIRDPFDAQHMGIENLKFLREDDFISFEVKSTEEIEKKDTTKKTISSIISGPMNSRNERIMRSPRSGPPGHLFRPTGNGWSLRSSLTSGTWTPPITARP